MADINVIVRKYNTVITDLLDYLSDTLGKEHFEDIINKKNSIIILDNMTLIQVSHSYIIDFGQKIIERDVGFFLEYDIGNLKKIDRNDIGLIKSIRDKYHLMDENDIEMIWDYVDDLYNTALKYVDIIQN